MCIIYISIYTYIGAEIEKTKLPSNEVAAVQKIIKGNNSLITIKSKICKTVLQ